jgi:RHS repeat-associated protein
VARHDYEPFGGEISFSTSSPRYGIAGYGAPDTDVDLRFTGKERDSETGLDYFGARYLSAAQGRFTTPDPLHGSAHLEDPQTWNRYSYAANNPLKYNDPAGLWNWDATAGGAYTDEELEERRRNKDLTRRERNEAKNALTFRANFRAARDAAEAAALASGDISAQQSVAAWGTENDGNNVSVGWLNVATSSARVELLKNSDNIVASFDLNLTGNRFAATLAHEGRHVADANNWLIGHFAGGGLNMNHYFRELRAWQVSGVMAEALGMKQFAPKGGGPEYQVWNRGWKAADVQTLRSTGISNILKNLYFAAPSDSNTYSSEHPHRP